MTPRRRVMWHVEAALCAALVVAIVVVLAVVALS
jgi:hypothetical protein